MEKKRIFVIGGPTAGGKSALSIRLAQKIGGEIVNGDAVQVYKDLRILSARPSIEDEKLIPHHLFGYVDCWTNPSIMDWIQQVEKVVQQIDIPIVVGGTGMYLDALVNGISPIPDVPPEVRVLARKTPLEEVIRKVKNCPFTDPQRLRRAYEVQLATGKTLAYFQKLPKKKFVEADFEEIIVLPDREKVYASCEQRFKQMEAEGAIEEVIDLMKKNPKGGVLKAIGVREISAYIAGAISKEQMEQEVITSTRQYAKRQMTWFRHHGNPKIVVTDPKEINLEKITK